MKRITAIAIAFFGLLTFPASAQVMTVAAAPAVRESIKRDLTSGDDGKQAKASCPRGSEASEGALRAGLPSPSGAATVYTCRQKCGDDDLCIICCLHPDPSHCY
jgi:hypothetical protein